MEDSPLKRIEPLTKNLLTGTNGKIFEDNVFLVNYKSEYQGCVGRIAFQINSKEEPI